jgi:hypothetical protein
MFLRHGQKPYFANNDGVSNVLQPKTFQARGFWSILQAWRRRTFHKFSKQEVHGGTLQSSNSATITDTIQISMPPLRAMGIRDRAADRHVERYQAEGIEHGPLSG